MRRFQHQRGDGAGAERIGDNSAAPVWLLLAIDSVGVGRLSREWPSESDTIDSHELRLCGGHETSPGPQRNRRPVEAPQLASRDEIYISQQQKLHLDVTFAVA